MAEEENVYSATDADESGELPGVFGQMQHTMNDEEHDERRTPLANHKHGKKKQILKIHLTSLAVMQE